MVGLGSAAASERESSRDGEGETKRGDFFFLREAGEAEWTSEGIWADGRSSRSISVPLCLLANFSLKTKTKQLVITMIF